MSGKTVYFDGIPVFVPNDIVADKGDFYISYNSYDTAIYGDKTTALVLGNQVGFLILNGDHREQYKQIISSGGGLDECLSYFRNNKALKSKYSDD